MVTKLKPLAALLVVTGALVMALPASGSRAMLLGLFDDATALDSAHDNFPLLRSLNVQVVRMTLTWGGAGGVANKQPTHPADPSDPAYQWSRYDQAVERANAVGIQLLFTIVGTPAWANGGKSPQYAPTSAATLRAFAYAAAERYSGTFLDVASGTVLPRVGLWLAWNEPNNPVFLEPQFTRVDGRWKMAAAAAYAQICNAVYAGVHAVGGPEEVACGATAPRGNNNPSSARASITPLAFLRSANQFGLRTFDAWAHHPYYGNTSDTPTTRDARGGAIELGNIDTLVAEVTKLYGTKPIWITEYGYQTNPPDLLFGVSWAKQATFLREAYDVARANPRIALFTWFLLKDSPSLGAWQSGLITASGRKKPSFAVFSNLRASSL